MCIEVASASDDPHVSTINSDSFDLWRTRWSTFVQVHLASVGAGCWCEVMFVCTEVQHVLLHFLHQVRINGSWLGTHSISVHSGSLESSNLSRALEAMIHQLLCRSDTGALTSEIQST